MKHETLSTTINKVGNQELTLSTIDEFRANSKSSAAINEYEKIYTRYNSKASTYTLFSTLKDVNKILKENDYNKGWKFDGSVCKMSLAGISLERYIKNDEVAYIAECRMRETGKGFIMQKGELAKLIDPADDLNNASFLMSALEILGL